MSDLPSWARKGVKVVCVSGLDYSRWTVGGWAPKTNGVYTIRSVSIIEGVEPCLCLEEYRHPNKVQGQENGWQISHFRPLVSDKTEAEDVALFKHHLDHTAPADLEPAA